MTGAILLTGGTGTLGRRVAPLLHRAGVQLRVLSRRPHGPEDGVEFVQGDLASGEGITAAMRGVETILHCAGSAKGDQDKARNLVQAASGAGVRHLVYISVVGADRVPVHSWLDRAMFGYFAAKRAAELIVADSGLPWTTLRATQFYDSILTMVQKMAKVPVILVPGVRFQPVDTGEVASRLVALTLGTPTGLVPDLSGPRVYTMKELVRSYLHASHKRRLTVSMRPPGGAARAIRSGATLASGPASGQRSWEAFLADRLATGPQPAASSERPRPAR